MRLLLTLAALLIATPAHAGAITPKPGKVIKGGAPNSGAYKVLDHRKGDCTGCVVDGVEWNVDRHGIDARGWDNFTLQNSTITLRSPTSGGDDPAAIVITATTRPGGRYFILNNTFRAFKMVPVRGVYMQGESVNCDDRKAEVTLTANKSYGNGDAGYDLKCTMTMDANYTEGANYGYRLWGVFQGKDNVSHNPNTSHLWVSAGANGKLDGTRFTGDRGKPVLTVSNAGARVELTNCHYAFPVPTKVLAGPAKFIKASTIVLDKSCAPDANGYAANTVEGVCTFDKPLADRNSDGIIDLGAVNRAKCGGARSVRLLLNPGAKALSAPSQYVYEKVS